jgi:Uma2 family endonuclease
MQTIERRARKTVRPAVRIGGRFDIPRWVKDHESFRKWARSPESPEHMRVAYFGNALWVDPDMEQLFIHNQVKFKIGLTLGALAEGKGMYITEGMLLSNAAARFSTIPDGYFVSYDALHSGRIRQVAGRKGGCVELEGTPEIVVEVVSDSSEEKDMIDLRQAYWKAGIAEYWLVDARYADVKFDLLKRGPKGYVATRKQAGWLRSEVFDRSFRLARQDDPLGNPVYSLEVK